MKKVKTLIAAIMAVLLLSSCAQFQSQSQSSNPIRKPLQDVVDALSFAIDEAAKEIENEKLWQASKAELAHWTEACAVAEDVSANSCSVMQNEASVLCRSACPSGACNIIEENYCKGLSEGVDIKGQCKAGGAPKATWCDASSQCMTATAEAQRVCSVAKSFKIPVLKQATANLNIERSVGGSAGINVLFLSINGGATHTTGSTIVENFRPRIREREYGAVGLPALPATKNVSTEAKNMAKTLTSLIVEAVRASVKEYEGVTPAPANLGATPPPPLGAKPPLMIDSIDINFLLAIDESGGLNIKADLPSIPVGIAVGAEAAFKSTNALRILYAQ